MRAFYQSLNAVASFAFLLAATTQTRAAPIGYDGKEWKFKVGPDGHIVMTNGKPVVIKPDGGEVEFDINVPFNTITRLTGELGENKTARGQAEARLAKFGNLTPEQATEAFDKLSKIDQKKLIDSGEVDKVKDEIAKGFTEKLAAKDKELGDMTGKLNGYMIGNAFKSSKFIGEKMIIPADMVQATFGRHFKVNGDEVQPVGQNGERLYSKSRPGEFATFDEALEQIIGDYAGKGAILKGGTGTGSGTGAPNGQGGKKTYTRSQFDAMAPGEKGTVGAAVGKGEAAIIDG